MMQSWDEVFEDREDVAILRMSAEAKTWSAAQQIINDNEEVK